MNQSSWAERQTNSDMGCKALWIIAWFTMNGSMSATCSCCLVLWCAFVFESNCLFFLMFSNLNRLLRNLDLIQSERALITDGFLRSNWTRWNSLTARKRISNERFHRALFFIQAVVDFEWIIEFVPLKDMDLISRSSRLLIPTNQRLW